MIIGETNTEKDLEVSPVRAKRLTNIRAAGENSTPIAERQ
jgi:predicted membrane GTPase involved in stress response